MDIESVKQKQKLHFPGDLALSALQLVDAGIVLFNMEGKIVFVNKQFEELLGYSASEVIGLNRDQYISLLLSETGVTCVQSAFDRCAGGETLISKHKFVHKSSQVVPLEIRCIPLQQGDNLVSGLMVIFRDLHEDLMVEITNLVNSTLSLREVLNNTVIAVVDSLGLASTAIFLLNDEKNELQLICCNAFTSEEDLAKAKWKIGEGPPGKIVQAREPVYVRNLRTHPDLDEYVRQFHGNKSSIGYPLICKDEILGAIAFDADTVRDFSEKEMILFQHISNQVALAIYNARLFSRLEHLSSTDGLTGLYNHRYFQQLLGNQISDSSMDEGSFGVLLIDADNFKRFNDRFGHLLGDQLLQELAQVISKNVRNCDMVARYGGEEFAVILPGCSKEVAVIIAQRIRKAVEHFDFCSNTEAAGRITISIGVAMYPEEKNKRNLLHRADEALYRAKQLGRNRVEVFGMYT